MQEASTIREKDGLNELNEILNPLKENINKTNEALESIKNLYETKFLRQQQQIENLQTRIQVSEERVTYRIWKIESLSTVNRFRKKLICA